MNGKEIAMKGRLFLLGGLGVLLVSFTIHVNGPTVSYDVVSDDVSSAVFGGDLGCYALKELGNCSDGKSTDGTQCQDGKEYGLDMSESGGYSLVGGTNCNTAGGANCRKDGNNTHYTDTYQDCNGKKVQ
jgi:hypothetical protein